MEIAVDSPAIALFNPPAPGPSLRASPRHFVTRSLRNLRQGNFALFVVFCGCLVIFVRALFGVGYDEGSSAHADAASAKHPSLLARWGSQPQHAIEEQWKKLRQKRSDVASAGLWAKIRKEDEGVATSASSQVPGADALHWLRVMEDRALTGLGRKPRPDTLAEEPVQQLPVSGPEHPIADDLDEHDGHDEDEHQHAHPHNHVHPPPAPHDAPPVANDAHSVAPPENQRDAPSPDASAADSSVAGAAASPPSSQEPNAENVQPVSPPRRLAHDPEHEDEVDDEPIYVRDEHR